MASTEIAPVLALREKLTSGLEAELSEIELKVTTDYTLADAIREGASVSGQRVGGWIDNGQSCALGAAWIAAKARGYVE